MSDTIIKKLEALRNRISWRNISLTLTNEEMNTLDAAIAELRGAGEPVAWLIEGEDAHPDGWGKFRVVYLHNAIADYRDRDPKATSTPLYARPEERDSLDAKRYQWLRKQHWENSAMCVASSPKKNVKLGTYCPSDERLDAAIDAAMRLDMSGWT